SGARHVPREGRRRARRRGAGVAVLLAPAGDARTERPRRLRRGRPAPPPGAHRAADALLRERQPLRHGAAHLPHQEQPHRRAHGPVRAGRGGGRGHRHPHRRRRRREHARPTRMEDLVILDRTTAPYTVDVTATVLEALRRISENKARVAFVLDEHGTVRGTLSDGDIRRWLVEHTAPDLAAPAVDAANPRFVSVPEGTPIADIVPLFRDGVDRIPVLDERGRLVAVATPGTRTLTRRRRTVGEEHPALNVGASGDTHQGDVELAKTLVDHCVDAGVDVVKFQLRDMAALYRSGGSASAGEDLGPQYTMNLLAKYSLSVEDMYRVFDHCAAREVDVICTPWDLPSADALQRYGVPGFKIASADLTNHDLLAHVAGFGAPMIVSTGMSTEQEITGAVEVLRGQGAPFGLLQTQSTYPAPYKDV